MSGYIIPVDQNHGTARIRHERMAQEDARTLAAFEAFMLDQARARGLQVNVEEDLPSGDLIVRWRPDPHAA